MKTETLTLKNLPLLATALLVCWHLSASAQTTNRGDVTISPRRTVGAQDLQRSLSLTHEQAKNLEPFFREQQARMAAMRTNTSLSRQERMAAIKDMRKNADEKMKAHLTPEQLQKMQHTRQVPTEFVRPPQAKGHPATRPPEAQQDSKIKPAADHPDKPDATASDDKR